MLVLHRAKLLASNQSVLALGVAPSRVRAAAPHSARHGRRGVCPKALHDAEPTKHTQPFTGERGLGIGIINQKFISKTDFFYNLLPPVAYAIGGKH